MIFRRDPHAAAAARLYQAIVAQARRPAFYATGGVPDSLDGRFEMLALHMVLVMRRLKELGQPGADLAQRLSEAMIADLDGNLREMGAGDLGVGRRVKQMAQGLYGRAAAYEAGLAEGRAVLAEALRRNLFATAPARADQLEAAVDYAQAAAAALAAQPAAALLAGQLHLEVQPMP